MARTKKGGNGDNDDSGGATGRKGGGSGGRGGVGEAMTTSGDGRVLTGCVVVAVRGGGHGSSGDWCDGGDEVPMATTTRTVAMAVTTVAGITVVTSITVEWNGMEQYSSFFFLKNDRNELKSLAIT